MGQFFAAEYKGASFSLFSSLHLKTLLIILVFNLAIFVYLKWRDSHQVNIYFRWGLAGLLLLGELALVLWHIGTGQFSVAYSLPLHLCRLAAILAVVMLITNSKQVYQIVYFIGLGAAVPALVSPDLSGYNFPHFAFFKFFINHSGIVTAVIYMTLIEGYRPQFKSIVKTLIGLNLYAGVIFLFNSLVGGNYLYLQTKPPSPSIMDYLGSWPWYIINLELIAVGLFLVYYLPFFLSKLISNYNQKMVNAQDNENFKS